MKKIVAVILAGGRGQRMASMCHHRAKPIVPFGGNLRVIDFTLTNCVHSGIRDILVLVDYRRGSLTEYLTAWRGANGVDNTLRILEPGEKGFAGTADAVRRNLQLIEEYSPDAVLVLGADHVYSMDYRAFIESHFSMGSDVTVAVKQVPLSQASRFGVVTLGRDGRITEFLEKPSEPHSNLVSMGIYVFNTQNLVEGLARDEYFDFGKDVIPSIIGGDRVSAYRYEGYWQDVGTIGSYYTASMDLLRNPPSIGLNGSWPLLTGVPGTAATSTTNNVNVHNSILGPGCVIEGRVENSVLGENVHIKPHSVVMNSILLSNSEVDEYSLIDHCILDEHVKVDRFCYLGRPRIYSSSDITVFDRGTIVSQYDSILCNYKKVTLMHPDYLAEEDGFSRVEAR